MERPQPAPGEPCLECECEKNAQRLASPLHLPFLVFENFCSLCKLRVGAVGRRVFGLDLRMGSSVKFGSPVPRLSEVFHSG